MPISHGDQLFGLIQSLSKSEKRNFRLYARRIQGEGDAKFLQLFDQLEKLKSYDEEALLRKMRGTNKSQFSNLKRHLYTHILTSLRLIQISKSQEIEVREWIDYADILYGKGLYLQALKLLNKAKTQAIAINHDLLHLEIVEFEKRIESRHITRATTERMQNLTEEAEGRSRINLAIVELSNLKLMLQRRFINQGHVKNDAERSAVEAYLQQHLPSVNRETPTFFEKVYYYQVFFWQHYLLMEYDQCRNFARKWVDLYHSDPHMIQMDVDMYMIGLHHLLITSFYLRDYDTFTHALSRLETFREDHYASLNYNSKILSFLFTHQARYNRHFLDGSFQDGLKLIPRTLRRLKLYEARLDRHKVLILYYKMAWTYMGAGRPDQAIDYLNKILNASGRSLREDLQAYAQLFFIMAHYDLGNFDLLDYLVNNTSRFISNMQDPSKLQKAAIQFFRSLLHLNPDKLPERFAAFRDRMETLRQDPYERRSFIFLDLSAWVEGKIQQKPLAEVVCERFLKRGQ